MTGWYMREIPESVRVAVEQMGAEMRQLVDSKTNVVEPGRVQ
jgi:hypothetical protein